MEAVPETRYARSDGFDIAYQAFGDGDIPFVAVPPIVSNIELIWEDPSAARFLRRLGSFTRFIHFDKRGTGVSERSIGNPTLEQRIDDFRAVMDAEGVERAVISGLSEGGLMAAYFAATHPERTTSLILCGTTARFVNADGYDVGATPEVFDQVIAAWVETWGTPQTMTVSLFAPSRAADPDYLRWINRYERNAVTPKGLEAMMNLNKDLDVRGVLSAINVPTLVLHRTNDIAVPVGAGRYVADHITGAKYVECPGLDHLPWLGDSDAILDEIEEFVTGQRSADLETDRVLATVLFTDIVDSTKQVTAMGDRKWRAVLDDLDTVVAARLERYRGRMVKSTGDGHLALFDGPARAVRCATELCGAARSLGLQVRAGLHAGEVELRGEDVGGISVHIGARVSALAGPSEVLVSRTVTDLVAGSGIEFADRGEHELKGVAGRWQVYAVAS